MLRNHRLAKWVFLGLFCLIYTPLFGASDTLVSINIIDRNGLSQTISSKERLKRYQNVNFLRPHPYQKVMRVFRPTRNIGTRAIITSYHSNGQPKQYLEVVNNRAQGSYKEWFSNGKPRLEAKVIGGVADIGGTAEESWVFDGKCLAWHEEGPLAAEILYSKGAMDGVSTYYHSDGSVWKKVPYKGNAQDGKEETFLSTGEFFASAEYKGGQPDGQAIKQWADAPHLRAAEELFLKGRLVQGSYYDKNGKTLAQVENGSGFRALFSQDCVCELQEFRDGVLDGEVRTFATDGQLAKIHHIKNRVKHGQETVYYNSLMGTQNQQPQMSLNWHQGRVQGVVKTWYDNGTLESQREMSDNRKHGLCTAWYPDGSLMLIEEYDMDKLLKGEYHKQGEGIAVSRVVDGSGVCTLSARTATSYVRFIILMESRKDDTRPSKKLLP